MRQGASLDGVTTIVSRGGNSKRRAKGGSRLAMLLPGSLRTRCYIVLQVMCGLRACETDPKLDSATISKYLSLKS